MRKVILAAVLLAGLSITSCKSKASEDGMPTDTDTVVTDVDTVMSTDTISVTTDTVRSIQTDTVTE